MGADQLGDDPEIAGGGGDAEDRPQEDPVVDQQESPADAEEKARAEGEERHPDVVREQLELKAAESAVDRPCEPLGGAAPSMKSPGTTPEAAPGSVAPQSIASPAAPKTSANAIEGNTGRSAIRCQKVVDTNRQTDIFSTPAEYTACLPRKHEILEPDRQGIAGIQPPGCREISCRRAVERARVARPLDAELPRSRLALGERRVEPVPGSLALGDEAIASHAPAAGTVIPWRTIRTG